jgi:hypothetical protein
MHTNDGDAVFVFLSTVAFNRALKGRIEILDTADHAEKGGDKQEGETNEREKLFCRCGRGRLGGRADEHSLLRTALR